MIVHHDKKGSKSKVLILLGALVLVYGIFFSPLSQPIYRSVHVVASPLWGAGTMMGNTISPFTSYFSSRRALYLENEELKAEVSSMVAKVSDRDFLREENKILKKELGRESEETRILAVVLAKPDRTLYDTLLIDVGEKQGVTQGNLVLLENVAIGEIEEVFSSSSKVRLFSSPAERHIVSVGTEGLTAESVGLGGGNFEIQFPKDSSVFIGDTVYLPSIEPHVLGIVERIESAAGDSFMRVLFRNPVNPFTVRFVEVAL